MKRHRSAHESRCAKLKQQRTAELRRFCAQRRLRLSYETNATLARLGWMRASLSLAAYRAVLPSGAASPRATKETL